VCESANFFLLPIFVFFLRTYSSLPLPPFVAATTAGEAVTVSGSLNTFCSNVFGLAFEFRSSTVEYENGIFVVYTHTHTLAHTYSERETHMHVCIWTLYVVHAHTHTYT